LRCPHCGHVWEYGGRRQYYATCPRCTWKVSLRRHAVDAPEPAGEVGVRLRCHRCGHEWLYRGRSRHYATCPACYTKVDVRKNRLLEPSPQRICDLREGGGGD